MISAGKMSDFTAPISRLLISINLPRRACELERALYRADVHTDASGAHDRPVSHALRASGRRYPGGGHVLTGAGRVFAATNVEGCRLQNLHERQVASGPCEEGILAEPSWLRLVLRCDGR